MVRLRQGSDPGDGGDNPNFFSEPGSFAAFYRCHYMRFLRYVLRRIGDTEQAPDLTAEMFTRAFAARKRLRGGSEPEALAWMFQIAKNLIAEFYEDGAARTDTLRRMRFQWPPASDEELRRVEELADAKSSTDALAEALSSLTHAERDVVLRHIVEDTSFPDIVGHSGETPDAARMRFGRALEKLRVNRVLRKRLGR